MTSATLRAVLRRPFREQLAFFRAKLGDRVPTQTFRDVMREQHDRAFMVAGAQNADLLADLAAAVDAAIAHGETLDQFRARFRETVRRTGWTGWTGEGSEAGRNWRTRIIYRTNMQASYAAGRYAQLQEFPLWVYRHGGSRDPRPQHLAWNGLTLPREDPFWRTHYPPNGWGCSCYVVGASSEATARAMGGEPGRAPPSGWDRRYDDGTLPGVDEGWDYAPGASVVQTVRAAAQKAVAWPYDIAKAYMEAVPASQRDALAQAIRRQRETGEAIRRFARAALGETRGYGRVPDYATLGLLTRREADEIGRLLNIAALSREMWDWTLSAKAVREMVRGAEGDWTAADFARLPVWLRNVRLERAGDDVRMTARDGAAAIVMIWRPLQRQRMLTLVSVRKRRAPRAERP